MSIVENHLAHWGVLGMHWGVHRGTSGSSGKPKGKSDSSNSEDHERVAALRKKKLSQLSNAEIKELAARMQLEKQFKDLTKKEISPGEKLISDVLMESGKQLATKYTTKYLGEGADKLIGELTKETAKKTIADATAKKAEKVVAEALTKTAEKEVTKTAEVAAEKLAKKALANVAEDAIEDWII